MVKQEQKEGGATDGGEVKVEVRDEMGSGGSMFSPSARSSAPSGETSVTSTLCGVQRPEALRTKTRMVKIL